MEQFQDRMTKTEIDLSERITWLEAMFHTQKPNIESIRVRGVGHTESPSEGG